MIIIVQKVINGNGIILVKNGKGKIKMKTITKILLILTIIFGVLTFTSFLLAIWLESAKLGGTGFLLLVVSGIVGSMLAIKMSEDDFNIKWLEKKK